MTTLMTSSIAHVNPTAPRPTPSAYTMAFSPFTISAPGAATMSFSSTLVWPMPTQQRFAGSFFWVTSQYHTPEVFPTVESVPSMVSAKWALRFPKLRVTPPPRFAWSHDANSVTPMAFDVVPLTVPALLVAMGTHVMLVPMSAWPVVYVAPPGLPTLTPLRLNW